MVIKSLLILVVLFVAAWLLIDGIIYVVKNRKFPPLNLIVKVLASISLALAVFFLNL